jgi:hypothetical protein
LGARVDAAVNDGDLVQRRVQAAIAVSVEPVPPLSAGGGVERSDARKPSDLGVASEAHLAQLVLQAGSDVAQVDRVGGVEALGRLVGCVTRGAPDADGVERDVEMTEGRGLPGAGAATARFGIGPSWFVEGFPGRARGTYAAGLVRASMSCRSSARATDTRWRPSRT